MNAISLDIPAKLLPFLQTKRRFKVAHGGRGGAKSWSIARMLLIRAYSEKDHLILCAREFQTSIADSVHALLKNQIIAMGLDSWFKVTDQEIYCWLTNSRFIFKGLRRNINEIKSTEGVTICWVEEAQAVSENSWLTLIPTIRAKGSEIWVSFNPMEENDPTYRRFVLNPPPHALAIEINWSDNPWFPEDLEAERQFMLRTDPDAYDWIWNGQTRHVSEATIFRGRFRVEAFETPETVERFLYGADWGFAIDPTVLMRMYIDDRGPGRKRLHIDHEAYGVGIETDDVAALFNGGFANKNGAYHPGIPGAKDWPIKADAARPETISFVRRLGFNISAAKKWSGSVEDGIAYLKTYDEIIIHPRCTHMAMEARLYSYAVDKQTNDILPKVADAHNHCWDAVRYAHDGWITAKGAIGTWSKLAAQA
jgi:phage terminase large subunit